MPSGPLSGYVAGVKDVFDTADLPTSYGSPIYAVISRAPTPARSRCSVAPARSSSAKTVSAELAMFSPGPTTNPWRATHTPGGSSSGSAAAVAAGMCDIALGTQTAGSVIRPASFCGVFGFKPTFGHVTTAGVKPVAQSLDTVGWFARDLDAIDAVRVALTGRAPAVADLTPRFGLARTEQWDAAEPDCQQAVSDAALRVHTVDVPPAPVVDGLAAEQPIVQAYEAARSLAWEYETRRDELSANLVEILEWAASISAAEYDRVLARAGEARRRIVEVFDHVDVLITPGVIGEAPAGLDATGDPRFCRLWTLLGCPTMSVPGALGASGLPIGVQLVGRPGADATLVNAARLLCR